MYKELAAKRRPVLKALPLSLSRCLVRTHAQSLLAQSPSGPREQSAPSTTTQHAERAALLAQMFHFGGLHPAR